MLVDGGPRGIALEEGEDTFEIPKHIKLNRHMA